MQVGSEFGFSGGGPGKSGIDEPAKLFGGFSGQPCDVTGGDIDLFCKSIVGYIDEVFVVYPDGGAAFAVASGCGNEDAIGVGGEVEEVELAG